MSVHITGFPTSSDIWLELNGKKVAVVQSYACRTSRDSAAVQGPQHHEIELTRLYATDEAIADNLSFHDLKDFSLVICKPDRRVIYSGCQWSGIQEEGKLREMVVEKLSLVARHRMESGA